MRIDNLEIRKIDEKLKEKMKEIEYKTWFKSALNKAYMQDDVIYLVCENEFYVDIINKRYAELLKEITSFEVDFLVEKSTKEKSVNTK